MIPLFKRSAHVRGRARVLAAGALLALAASPLHATPVPANLGNGLDRLVRSHVDLKRAAQTRASVQTYAARDGRAYTTEESAALADLALRDDSGRFLVRIYGDGSLKINKVRKALKGRFGSFSAGAIDKQYHGTGVMNAFIALEDVADLARTPGVSTVVLELRPYTSRSLKKEAALAAAATNAQTDAIIGAVYNKLGTAFDQGITQHRVDQINKFYNPNATLDIQGQGMQIGFMSDSFNARSGAATAVTNFDLPGAANNPAGNTNAVVVLEDQINTTNTDEGRGMGEIIYKMAPKATIAFATAFTGEVGFANNIRALAGIPAFIKPGQTFVADSICDDVGYFDEPFFQDGIIGQGVDDAFAYGASYFSSAANNVGVNGYNSEARWVDNGTGNTAAAGNTALANTNIDLTGVPANLYAGGFHNFNPAGLDVAQTVNVQTATNAVSTILQWNEAYDQNTAPNLVQPPLFSATGTISNAQTTQTFSVPGVVAGTLYQFLAAATAGSGVDVTITITAPSGAVVINGQDTTIDESARFFAPESGTYTVTIGRFSTTVGDFTLTVNAANGFVGGQKVVTDVNLLVFNLTTGAYIASSSLTSNNFATNQPIELGVTPRPAGATQVQYVLARANKPASGGLTQLRYQLPGNGLTGLGPAEYFTYNNAITGGHAMAAGNNGSAAYSAFRPSLPEGFSSPGPAVIYFDKNSNPLATPEVRLQPRIAAMDNGNTSFFGGDSAGDADTQPNFSGTSAASPHGAAIAALVIQAGGGRRSLTPTQVRTLLQSTAFPHDLDPAFSSGTARVSTGGKVTVSVNSDNSSTSITVPTGTAASDNNSFRVTYTGASALTSLSFNPAATAATAGGTSNGTNGVTYSTTGVGGTATYFENSFPGMVFSPASKPFTVGSASTIPATAVVATPANAAPAPAAASFWTLNLAFNGGTFTGGNVLRFNVGRSLQRSSSVATGGTSTVNYNADLLGGTISLPNGRAGNGIGMTFTGTTADGGTFTGTINNRIGAGYSVLDGYGFLDAEAAVKAAIPATPTKEAQ